MVLAPKTLHPFQKHPRHSKPPYSSKKRTSHRGKERAVEQLIAKVARKSHAAAAAPSKDDFLQGILKEMEVSPKVVSVAAKLFAFVGKGA